MTAGVLCRDDMEDREGGRVRQHNWWGCVVLPFRKVFKRGKIVWGPRRLFFYMGRNIPGKERAIIIISYGRMLCENNHHHNFFIKILRGICLQQHHCCCGSTGSNLEMDVVILFYLDLKKMECGLIIIITWNQSWRATY